MYRRPPPHQKVRQVYSTFSRMNEHETQAKRKPRQCKVIKAQEVNKLRQCDTLNVNLPK